MSIRSNCSGLSRQTTIAMAIRARLPSRAVIWNQCLRSAAACRSALSARSTTSEVGGGMGFGTTWVIAQTARWSG